MSTNYYLTSENVPCPECGTPGAGRRHLGKSSGGWVFALHVYPDDDIHTLGDVVDLITAPGVRVIDEYGRTHTAIEFLTTVMNRCWNGSASLFTPKFLAQNHAEPGPRGLLRSVIDGKRVIGHGRGTWDYHVGDESSW